MAVELKVVDLQLLPPSEELLSRRESVFLSTLKLPKRRREWLGGRLALKILAGAYFGVALNEVELLAQPDTGKPALWVRGREEKNLAFSITHSHGYAVAGIAPQEDYLGIDLEKITPRIDAWKKDFFHPSELTAQGDGFLTTLWTQKEAAVKLLGTGLCVNSFDVRCIGGKVSFYARALEVYKALGSPEITLSSPPLLDGFAFSTAAGKLL
jgi:4'-phosphopantetheinyl transferase